MIRDLTNDDLDYFLKAGESYTNMVGFHFDPETYTKSLDEMSRMENIRFFVLPGKAHCIAMLADSVYGDDVVVKILSTWGSGGIDCLRKAIEWAKESGATRIIADAGLEPRIAKFYKRVGMKECDTNYMGEL